VLKRSNSIGRLRQDLDIQLRVLREATRRSED
jgi:hypothetical protein